MGAGERHAHGVTGHGAEMVEEIGEAVDAACRPAARSSATGSSNSAACSDWPGFASAVAIRNDVDEHPRIEPHASRFAKPATRIQRELRSRPKPLSRPALILRKAKT